MPNPLFDMMGGNMPPIVRQFMQFKQNFHGDAQAQVQQMLNSGRISQADYNRAVQLANQFQAVLTPSVRR